MKRVRSLLLIAFAILVVGGYFIYLTFSGLITPNPISEAVVTTVRPYPELTNPKAITLNCDYHGQNIRVDETVYGSLADYYRTNPAKLSAFHHDADLDYIFSYKQDQTIPELADKIEAVGAEKGLSSDQTLDLAGCLLQSIPYDTDKAARILSPDYYKLPVSELVPRYPYETLYDEKGICTDKSYLGVAVFRELGYSTSLLTFDAQRHMTIGIEVPAGYGDFGTNYAVIELTGKNFLVGDIPEISADAGLAVGGAETIPNVTTDSTVSVESKTALSNLSNTIVVSAGNVYKRITGRVALKAQLDDMQTQVANAYDTYALAKEALANAEVELQTAEVTYKANPTNATYAAYSRIYNSYLRIYNAAKTAVDNYNYLVNQYNALVTKYLSY